MALRVLDTVTRMTGMPGVRAPVAVGKAAVMLEREILLRLETDTEERVIVAPVPGNREPQAVGKIPWPEIELLAVAKWRLA